MTRFALLIFTNDHRLKRKINVLSSTKFGSQMSGINRLGMAVPNTNKHAVEGSNPIWTVGDFDSKGDLDMDNIRYTHSWS